MDQNPNFAQIADFMAEFLNDTGRDEEFNNFKDKNRRLTELLNQYIQNEQQINEQQINEQQIKEQQDEIIHLFNEYCDLYTKIIVPLKKYYEDLDENIFKELNITNAPHNFVENVTTVIEQLDDQLALYRQIIKLKMDEHSIKPNSRRHKYINPSLKQLIRSLHDNNIQNGN